MILLASEADTRIGTDCDIEVDIIKIKLIFKENLNGKETNFNIIGIMFGVYC